MGLRVINVSAVGVLLLLFVHAFYYSNFGSDASSLLLIVVPLIAGLCNIVYFAISMYNKRHPQIWIHTVFTGILAGIIGSIPLVFMGALATADPKCDEGCLAPLIFLGAPFFIFIPLVVIGLIVATIAKLADRNMRTVGQSGESSSL